MPQAANPYHFAVPDFFQGLALTQLSFLLSKVNFLKLNSRFGRAFASRPAYPSSCKSFGQRALHSWARARFVAKTDRL